MQTKIIKETINTMLVVFFFVEALTTLERLYWLNSDTYNSMFTTKLDHFDENTDLIKFRKDCNSPLEINVTKNAAYIRCGMFWPLATAWIVPKSKFIPLSSISSSKNQVRY